MYIGDFKETYASDQAVFVNRTSRFWLGVLLVILLVFPFIAGDYMLFMANLAGITIPQSPSGVASMSPADIYAILDKKNLWADLDVVPHVTTKDQNLDAIKTYLVGLQKMGLDALYVLTRLQSLK